YKKITKDEYLKYKFDSDKLVNRGKLKYTSILNPFTLLINGFKKVFNYPFLKKILLVGFFVSAMFILYSISNIFGIINIKDEKFIQQNKDYLLIKSKKTNVDDYLKYELDENVKYLIPGNSIVSFKLTYNNFYQTSITSDYLKGSLSSIEMIKQNEIINGRMPENNHEIVVDKASVDSMFKKQLALQAGIKNIEDLIGKEVEIPNMPKFKIVGIVDKKSPSIYTSKDQFINIVANSISQNEEIINADMLDFKLMEGKFELRKGRLPENDYEVIVNIKNINEMKLNKQIKNTVNGRKLLVVGYYFDKYDSDVLLVNNNTIKYKVINNKSDIIVYTNKKEEVIKSFQAQDLNIQDIYTNNKTDYINKQKPVIMATLIMGGVILTISFVEILLIIRASFLSRVKEIGIYRAIGVKKKDIYKMFMGEIIAITTIASLPGYFFMAFVISKISTILIFKDQYLINPLVLILSIIIIYGFNIVVGLIPVFNTLRKTPAEILSRSDID
ncbi:MAG: ABC transporter permease, partial [Bacilli bacterium]